MPHDFKLKVPLQVRFRDTDAMGHVNNAVYLSYLELARMKYWEMITGLKDFSKVDLILANLEIDYRSPLMLGEDAEVQARVSELGRAGFTMEYRIVAGKAGRLIAEAATGLACYDYEKGRVKRLSEEIRRAIAEFENDPALFGAAAKAERALEEGGEGG